MGFRVVKPDDFEWLTRPHEPGEPARHVAELSDMAGFAHTRANVWRYEPGAKGRGTGTLQEETFVVLAGTLSMYVGDPPERHDVPAGGLIHIEPGTPLQIGEPRVTTICSSTPTACRRSPRRPRSSSLVERSYTLPHGGGTEDRDRGVLGILRARPRLGRASIQRVCMV